MIWRAMLAVGLGRPRTMPHRDHTMSLDKIWAEAGLFVSHPLRSDGHPRFSRFWSLYCGPARCLVWQKPGQAVTAGVSTMALGLRLAHGPSGAVPEPILFRRPQMLGSPHATPRPRGITGYDWCIAGSPCFSLFWASAVHGRAFTLRPRRHPGVLLRGGQRPACSARCPGPLVISCVWTRFPCWQSALLHPWPGICWPAPQMLDQMIRLQKGGGGTRFPVAGPMSDIGSSIAVLASDGRRRGAIMLAAPRCDAGAPMSKRGYNPGFAAQITAGLLGDWGDAIRSQCPRWLIYRLHLGGGLSRGKALTLGRGGFRGASDRAGADADRWPSWRRCGDSARAGLLVDTGNPRRDLQGRGSRFMVPGPIVIRRHHRRLVHRQRSGRRCRGRLLRAACRQACSQEGHAVGHCGGTGSTSAKDERSGLPSLLASSETDCLDFFCSSKWHIRAVSGRTLEARSFHLRQDSWWEAFVPGLLIFGMGHGEEWAPR